MKLFETLYDKNENLLPGDGIVNYFGRVIRQDEADKYLSALLSGIEWRNDEAVIFGRHIVTKRKVAWYGDREFSYTYSNITRQALSWTPELYELKKKVEKLTGETYNSCLLNLYHNGEEGMAYHSDDEKDLKKNGAIASLSLGAERKFAFRHKHTKETINIVLEHGSLLVMKGETQTNWLHRLPPTKRVQTPRVNLTFRTIVRQA
jgi:alkylated DNA repair dioxygenase AlkB